MPMQTLPCRMSPSSSSSSSSSSPQQQQQEHQQLCPYVSHRALRLLQCAAVCESQRQKQIQGTLWILRHRQRVMLRSQELRKAVSAALIGSINASDGILEDSGRVSPLPSIVEEAAALANPQRGKQMTPPRLPALPREMTDSPMAFNRAPETCRARASSSSTRPGSSSSADDQGFPSYSAFSPLPWSPDGNTSSGSSGTNSREPSSPPPGQGGGSSSCSTTSTPFLQQTVDISSELYDDDCLSRPLLNPRISRSTAATTTAASSSSTSSSISASSSYIQEMPQTPSGAAQSPTAEKSTPPSSSNGGSATEWVNCPRWWLRSTVVARRFSGAASDFSAEFERKVSQLQSRLGRRSSLSQDDIRHAELQRRQFAYLQEIQASAHRADSPAYRRSQSASSLNSVHAMLQAPRKGSRSFLVEDLGLNGEVWPEYVTGLLTGQQLLVDRSLLLSQLPPGPALRCQVESSSGARNGGTNNEEDDSNGAASPLRLLAGGCTLARPDKVTGEDAYFVCPSEMAIGVADGVGEWADLGCNAKNFADELMGGAAASAYQQAATLKEGRNSSCSSSNMPAAHKALKCLSVGLDNTVSYGSSTCLVAFLDGWKRQLGMANLGDSTGLVLRREGSLLRVFMTLRRTREQQHFFNCPYQLSRFPRPEEIGNLEEQGYGGLAKALSELECRLEGDTPEMADLYDVTVQSGDLVLLGTDGVFDNLFDKEVSSLVSLAISPAEAAILEPYLQSAKTGIAKHPDATVPPNKYEPFGLATPPEHIARALTAAAFHRSQDPRARTPFGRQSRRHGSYFCGGKLDDITVVAAWVV